MKKQKLAEEIKCPFPPDAVLEVNGVEYVTGYASLAGRGRSGNEYIDIEYRLTKTAGCWAKFEHNCRSRWWGYGLEGSYVLGLYKCKHGIGGYKLVRRDPRR